MKKLIATLAFIMIASIKVEAFQILSAVSSACHEKITLGALAEGDPDFIGDGTPAASAMLARFIDRVNETGVPRDAATQALIKEMTKRFHWEHMDETKRYVLMSLVAGARSPDTQGFSVIDINHIRGNHLTNEAQSIHLLRKRENDGPDGNLSAIQQTREKLNFSMAAVLDGWNNPGALDRGERWTFPFYGEQIAQVFGPAYDLGAIAHAIEDSYSHAIRGDDMKIVAIANYLEQILDKIKEDRDGPPHSDRMDQCNPHDDFDALRIHEARKQVATLFNAIDNELAANGTDIAPANTVLDTTLEYQPGCDSSNSYCGSSWSKFAHQKPSEAYSVGYNCGVVKAHGHHHEGDAGAKSVVVALLMLLPIAFVAWMRERRPKQKKLEIKADLPRYDY